MMFGFRHLLLVLMVIAVLRELRTGKLLTAHTGLPADRHDNPGAYWAIMAIQVAIVVSLGIWWLSE